MLARKFLIAALVTALGFSSAGVSADVPVHYVFQMPLRGIVQPASGSTTTSTTSGPQYAWVDQSQECPPGEEGSITWQEVFEVSPDYRSTGQTRDYQDTCMVPLGVPTLSGPGSAYPGASYTVSWTAVSLATHYELRLSDGQTAGTVYSGPDTSAPRVASMTAGEVDQLWTRACDSTRCGDWSSPISVAVVNPPAPNVPVLTASTPVVAGGAIATSWTSATSPGGYPVYYELVGHMNSDANASLYSGAAASKAVATTATTGTYYLSVRACDTYNCSGWGSANVTVNPPAPSAVPTLSVPASTYPGATYTVAWSGVAGASRYELARNGSTAYTGAAMSSSFTAGATVGTQTAFEVRACNVTGCGAWSAAGTNTVTNPPAPAVPSLTVSGAVVAGSNIATSWIPVSSPGGYALHYELVGHMNSDAAATLYSGGDTSTPVATSSAGTYYFSLRACDTYNCSAYDSASTTVNPQVPATAPTISATASVYPGKTVAVSWTSVSGATSYNVEYFVNGADQGLAYSGGATSLTTGAASGTVGTVYTYKAQACNVTGCGSWSTGASSTVVDPPAPATPTTLNAPASVIAGGGIGLSWGGSSSPQGYAFHYEVVYNTGSGNVSVYSGAGTSATIGGAGPAGATYNIYVRGCDTYGCSGWKQATTVVDPPAPATPSLSVPASVYPSKGYTVGWGASAYATRYELYEGGVGTIYSGSATSLARTASGTVGDTDSYQIRACNGTGCSSWSGVGTMTVADPPAPSEPSSLSVPSTVAPGGSMSISWGTSSDPQGYGFNYRLYGRLGTSGTWTLHNNSTARSDTVTAPTTTGTYYWIVRACDAYNCSTDRTGSTTVKVAETTLNASVSASSISIGKTSGSITITASGGTGSYTYLSPKFISGYQSYNGDTVSAGLSGNKYTWTVYSGTGSVAVSATYQIGVTSGTQTKTFNVTVWWTAGNGS